MVKPTSTPLPNHSYRDANGQMVNVTAVAHNRVTFYREGTSSRAYSPLSAS